jgi:pyrroline-5-carboxylate reductase
MIRIYSEKFFGAIAMLKGKKLTVLGAGKLGETLIKGLLEAGVIDVANITVTAAHYPRLQQLKEKFNIKGTLSNAEAVTGADVILMSLKPQTVPLVLSEIADQLGPSQLVISVAASVSTAFIEKHIAADVPVIRAMPNTASQINKGMTGIAPGTHAKPEHVGLAKFIFDSVGRTVVADEKHMDAITGL